jgi:chloramphenicol O-acetyltransferase
LLQLKPYKIVEAGGLAQKKTIQPTFSIGKACTKSGQLQFPSIIDETITNITTQFHLMEIIMLSTNMGNNKITEHKGSKIVEAGGLAQKKTIQPTFSIGKACTKSGTLQFSSCRF